MKIFLGSDHRGFKLKEKLKEYLVKEEYDLEDLGAEEFDKADDYTVFATRVASRVAENRESLGILFCGSGVGVDVTANKFDGVRASIGKEPEQVEAGRNDDNMNVLVIAADFTTEEEMMDLVEVFLKTNFSGKARHKRRLEDIKKIEENN